MDKEDEFYFWDEMWNEKDITKNSLEDKSMDDKD